jgi:hypothetical protein
MSFTFGGSASKSSGTSSNTSNVVTHSTTTPDVPTWLQDQTKAQSANIARLGSLDPSSLVAGANPLQTQAGNFAGSLTGTGNQNALDAVKGLDLGVAGNAAPTVRSQSAAAGLSKWYNPFQQNVIDTSAADFDHNAAMQHAQRTLDEAHSGAFGGSGAAIATTMGDDNSDRARASLLAGLRTTGFNDAASNSQQDAARAQSASADNANLAMQQQAQQLTAGQNIIANNNGNDANNRANLDAMFATGAGLHAIDQAKLSAPLDLQAWANSQFGTLPSNLFVGQTSDGTQTGVSSGKTSGTNLGVNASFTIPAGH